VPYREGKGLEKLYPLSMPSIGFRLAIEKLEGPMIRVRKKAFGLR